MDALNKAADKANDAVAEAAENLLGSSFKVGVSVPLLANLIIWIILGVLLGFVVEDSRSIYAAFVLAGWSFCILIHEMGHAAFSNWAGDASVKDYTNGNFLSWPTIINNYAAPMATSVLFGIGINGGTSYIGDGKIFEAATHKKMLVAFGGIIFSMALSLILAIPLWFLKGDHPSWVVCGLAILIYFNCIASVLNCIPFPPMDMFALLFPILPSNIQDKANEFIGNKWYSLVLLLIVIGFTYMFEDLIFDLAFTLVDILALKNEAAAGIGRFYIIFDRH